ncbi:RNA polymerase sporulation specific sigma factor SigH [Alkalibacterium sp. AK22]|uniref:sigma-70 family RNA polymerase sigma factor n=1 Tax=Alkalibacterium sp. AK22 TaxID=1229520 RepID=UPI000449E683|nr:sigma-70 family RNA polymerase sigma factor [Alkalibacterium sp. AK22]EXJ23790.1 RNA polymerase sporulation specific sigma factor SigH [Alkalibacterium sp. AK22]
MRISTDLLVNKSTISYRDISDPESDDLVLQIQKGELELFPLLLEKSEALLKRAIYRRFIKGFEREDLYQEACMILVEAVGKYKSDKGMSFNQYACLCLDNHFHKLIRWHNTIKRQAYRDALSLEKVVEEQGVQLVAESRVFMPADSPIIEETVDEYLTCLSPFERTVCISCYSGYSYDDIAAQLNCERQKVINAKHRCTEKFKKLFIQSN